MGHHSLVHCRVVGVLRVGSGGLGKKKSENAEPGLTQRIRAAIDMVQAVRLMRSFINIMFRAMMDLSRSPA